MHVDNRQICTSGLSTIGHIRTALTKSFDMILQDKVNQLVGVKIEQCVDRVFFHNLYLFGQVLRTMIF